MTAVETYTVREALSDQAGALLDELDTLISDLDAALAEQHAARLVIADAELEMALIEASLTLSTNGGNAETRKATVFLALRACLKYIRRRSAASMGVGWGRARGAGA